MASIPRYLLRTGERIWETAVMSAIDGEAWLDLQVPGGLLRLVLTPGELDELIAVAQAVRKQIPE